MNETVKKHSKLGKDKWGFLNIFLIPFFVAFLVFSFWPLIQTIYFSFFDHYFSQTDFDYVNKFAGLKNYKELFTPETARLFFNTMVMWILRRSSTSWLKITMKDGLLLKPSRILQRRIPSSMP